MAMTSNNTLKVKEVFRQLCRPYSVSAAGENEKNRFSKGWHEIVKTYGPLALTFPADKLIAFAGIAEEIQRHTGLTYYYGLWASSLQPGLFLSELLWSTPVGVNRCRSYGHNGIMRAPTFSWASLDGLIDYRLTFHDRIFNVSSGMRCLPKYKEADSTITYSEKGQVMVEISSFSFDLNDGVPRNISLKRKEPMVANWDDAAFSSSGSPSIFTNEDIDYRATVYTTYNPTSPESYVRFPFIALKGPLRKLTTTKTLNNEHDLIWSHPFLPQAPVFDSPSESTSDGEPQFSTQPVSMDEDWFHTDMHHVEAMPEGATLELYCLRIARWYRKLDKRWYVAGLVLVQDQSMAHWLHASTGKKDGLSRAGTLNIRGAIGMRIGRRRKIGKW
ncbi:hypothetical protein MMC14_006629 [Varicellaria rhodocarpa]|nr:hypothetical protein [Varicellaria rhodocarpa]